MHIRHDPHGHVVDTEMPNPTLINAHHRWPVQISSQLYKPAFRASHASLVIDDLTKHDGKTVLDLPREIRDRIYYFLVQDATQLRLRAWTSNPTTPYNGLLLVCKQLYNETSNTIFAGHVTQYRTDRLTTLPATSSAFLDVRSVNMEIASGLETTTLRGIADSLQAIQLCLQELRIVFLSNEAGLGSTGYIACGKSANDASLMPCTKLALDPAFVLRQLIILRPLIVLRQLRTLIVENADTPLVPAMICKDKSHLVGLSVVSSPQALMHNYSVLGLSPRQLTGLMVGSVPFPNIRVLELSANAVVPAMDILSGAMSALEHLSWRVPSSDFQDRKSTRFRPKLTFYNQTGQIIRALATWNEGLKVLRLCVDLPCGSDHSLPRSIAVGDLEGEIGAYLPRLKSLEYLEIHHACGRGFFRDELVSRLPKRLKRLYISDSMIAVNELVSQTQDRFFTLTHQCQARNPAGHLAAQNNRGLYEDSVTVQPHGYQDREGTVDTVHVSIDWTCGIYDQILSGARACSRLLLEKEDFLETRPGSFDREENLVGESETQHCRDNIPLKTGDLGFISYEYAHPNCENEDECFRDAQYESPRISLLRLNGRLLDREHNMHLLHAQEVGVFGIEPPQMKFAVDDVSETDNYSRHYNIHTGIYDSRSKTDKEEQQATEAVAELATCFQENPSLGDQHWYFGEESAAQAVFAEEPCAVIESIRYKSTIEDVEAPLVSRCKWTAPEYDVPAVGTWPEPVMPRDWRETLPKDAGNRCC